MKKHRKNSLPKGAQGFSLIELTIVLTIAGLLIAGAANLFHSYLVAERNDEQKSKITDIQSAMVEFFANDPDPDDGDPNDQEQRYPCPADPALAPGADGYGLEQRDPGGAGCVETGGIVRVDGAGGGNVYIGAVPFASLGISSESALDAYENQMTYAITEALTLDDALVATPVAEGEVEVTQEDTGGGETTTRQPFVVVSHGLSGAGAYTAQGTMSATACPDDADSRDAANCDRADALFKSFSRSEGGNNEFFDDTLVFSLIGADVNNDQLWAISPEDTNDIFNRNTGNVGIGITDPEERLHIAGDTAGIELSPAVAGANGFVRFNQVDGTDNGGLFFNETEGALGLARSISDAATNGLFVQADGDVGVGTFTPQVKLDVNGPVKIGTAADGDCVVATVGATRYNATDDNMEYCAADDGSGSPGWQGFGGGGQINYDDCVLTNGLPHIYYQTNATEGSLKDQYGNSNGVYAHAFCPDDYVMVGLKSWAGNSSGVSRVTNGFCCKLEGGGAVAGGGSPPPPPTADCAATSLSWSSGGQTCSATAPASIHLQSRSINDPHQDCVSPVGSATFQCNDGTWNFLGGSCTFGCSALCFTADTMVLMVDGSEKAIQDIVVGDVVIGQDGAENEVLELFQPVKPVGHILYAINDDNHFVTADHPFMTLEGWKSMDPELTAVSSPHLDVGKLSVGDTIITKDGSVEVTSISEEAITEETTTYNFRLSGNGTYYADGYLVSDYQGRGNANKTEK